MDRPISLGFPVFSTRRDTMTGEGFSLGTISFQLASWRARLANGSLCSADCEIAEMNAKTLPYPLGSTQVSRGTRAFLLPASPSLYPRRVQSKTNLYVTVHGLAAWRGEGELSIPSFVSAGLRRQVMVFKPVLTAIQRRRRQRLIVVEARETASNPPDRPVHADRTRR